MGLPFEESGPAATQESDEPDNMRIDLEEQRKLVEDNGRSSRNTHPSSRGEPSPLVVDNCSSFLAPIFVVLLALFGVAFYFSFTSFNRQTRDLRVQSDGTRDVTAPTILISIDGFRHEYLSRKHKLGDGAEVLLAPNLNEIATKGVYAEEGMQPVVPTLTFPNHWSLVTGLWPASSGIMGNTMFDPVKEKWFHLNRVNPEWWNGAPIWQTLKQTPRSVYDTNGTRTTLEKNYTTACVFWPGSDVPKHAADAFWAYNALVPYRKRVDRALALLFGTAPDLKQKASFVTLYFEGVDHAGHRNGPNSQEVEDEIKRVDDSIGYLVGRLGSKAPEYFNIVIVSDHGMTELSPKRSINLEPMLKKGTVQDIVISPMGLFLNMSITADELYGRLAAGLKPHAEHAGVYMKENLPERWHLRESRLITPVVTMATLGWSFSYPHQHLVPDTDKLLERHVVQNFTNMGGHGFDNTFEDMQALFVARGPAFRDRVTVKNLRSIDVYEMLCHIFGAQPAPNNGSLEATVSILVEENSML